MPLFLQHAVKCPQLWTPNSSISISRALHFHEYEVCHFVLFDTIAALALGTAPLLHYDTTTRSCESDDCSRILKRVHGCPPAIIILLARINSWRAARWIDPIGVVVGVEVGELMELEDTLRRWVPDIESVDGSANLIARMAIQECWRQTVLIYMYMASYSLFLFLFRTKF